MLNTIKLDNKISITICVHSVPVVDIMAEYDLDMSGGLLEVSWVNDNVDIFHLKTVDFSSLDLLIQWISTMTMSWILYRVVCVEYSMMLVGNANANAKAMAKAKPKAKGKANGNGNVQF